MHSPFEIFEREQFWRDHFERARLKAEHDDPAHPHIHDDCPFCATEFNSERPPLELTSELIEIDK